MQRQIFRRVALERLSSPEQLDQLMQVTTPRGWLALLALCSLLITAIIWGFAGSIPTEVAGRGVLLRGGRVYSIVAPTAGQVDEVYVRAGDVIKEGQVIANVTPATAASVAAGHQQAADLLSRRAGRILEMRVDKGSVVNLGAVIASLEILERPLEAVMYLPPADGKKVRPGMEVQVSPENVSREEYGFMRGVVKSVAEFPSTYEGMLLTLGNDQLVNEFLAAGAPIEIRVDFVPAAMSPSGYSWSSSGGPPFEIRTGTLCLARITLSRQRPIEQVLPIGKR